MLTDIPSDPLMAVFTPDVIDRLRRRQNPSDRLEHRLEVIALNEQDHGPFVRGIRAAWNTYVGAGLALGLFDGKHGQELRSRMTGPDDDSFRSAMSECLAAWYLADQLRLRVEARPEGRPGRPLEFLIRHPEGDINVEVKASYKPIPETGMFYGDDSDMLIADLRDANKQFARGVKNLLVLAPQMRVPVSLKRRTPLETAFIGRNIISIPISMRTGGPTGPTTFPFKESGYLTRSKVQPQFTRVSGVLYLGETWSDNYREIEHFALMIHNPNAPLSLPRDIWKDIPFFSEQGGRWVWSDTGKGGLF